MGTIKVYSKLYAWAGPSGRAVAGTAGSNPAGARMFVSCVFILHCPESVEASATSYNGVLQHM
jgi:hypothetical protein